MKPIITITYCPKCGWLLRSAYFAQEVLTTFTEHIDSVKLKPSEVSGVFSIEVDAHEIWNRKTDDGFPEIKVLKQRVRDLVAPELSLGHSDKN